MVLLIKPEGLCNFVISSKLAAPRTFNIAGEPKMTRFVARELATAHWFDISAAKRDLGYTAGISIDEGMKRLKAWLAESDFPSS